jgi:hypothetical protein
MGSGGKSGAMASMLRGGVKRNVVPLRETSIVMDNGIGTADEGLAHLDTPRRFPIVSSLPRMPLMIPDEILDYYGWVFCQGGFLNLQMTFEQFLTVVAAVSPSGLCPEYDEGLRVQTTD